MKAARVAAVALGVAASACGSSDKPPEVSPAASPTLWVEPQDSIGQAVPPFSQGHARGKLESRPFRLSDLPVVVSVAPAGSRAKESAIPELSVRSKSGSGLVQARVAPGSAARVIVADRPSGGPNGLKVQCGVWAAAPLRVEIVSFEKDGSLTYTQVSGIFDGSRCEAVGHERVVVKPAAIVPGLLFAVRVCREATCAAGQRVVFITPPLSQVEAESMGGKAGAIHAPFGLASFDVVRGGTNSLTAIVDAHALTQLFGGTAPEFPWVQGEGDIVVGVDLIEATQEKEPVAVAFFGRTQMGTVMTPEHFHER